MMSRSHGGPRHSSTGALLIEVVALVPLLILLFACPNLPLLAHAFQFYKPVSPRVGIGALLNHNLIETTCSTSRKLPRPTSTDSRQIAECHQTISKSSIWTRSAARLGAASSANEEKEEEEVIGEKADLNSPQVFATGYSSNPDLHTALQQAVSSALAALPPLDPDVPNDGVGIDLAFVTASSLYSASPATIVPAVLGMASVYGSGVDKLVGCTSGGMISSVSNAADANVDTDMSGPGRGRSDNREDASSTSAVAPVRECIPVETEGILGVSVTLALLPDVDVSTFHVLSEDVPDDVGRITTREWNIAVGLRSYADTDDKRTAEPIFMLLPSPAFQSDLDELLHGLSVHHPKASIIGGIASTVSSLSRAQLFRYDSSEPNALNILGDGCVGVVMNGDIKIETVVAQGAKPVGGIYRVVSAQESTIRAIMLDEEATKEDDEASDALAGHEEEEDDEEEMDAKAKAQAAYSKAAIPKPVLAGTSDKRDLS